MAALDTNAAAVLCCLVAEADLTTLVPRLKRSRSALYVASFVMWPKGRRALYPRRFNPFCAT